MKGFPFAFTLILNAALRNKKGISTNITRSIVVGEYEKCHPVLYREDNAVETFLDLMIEERKRIVKRLEKTEPIVMTPEDQKGF